MAINVASKFEKKTSDLMKARRKTQLATNQNWSWDGVNAINIYTLTDPTVNDYDPTASANRYGAPSEVQHTVQTHALSNDRSFSKTMDMSNVQDTAMVRRPGKYIAQAVKNVMVPEIDAYILTVLVTAGGTARSTSIVAAGATSSANAYTNFLAFNANITDNEAPEEGRVAFLTQAYYNFLKQGNFVLDSDIDAKARRSGVLGEVDGVKLVVVPSSRMPANTDLVITHPSVCVAPEKLKDVKIHKNPPGINGYLIEYRHRYDAFADVNRIACLGIHKTA